MSNPTDPRLTVVVARRIRAGAEQDYELAMREFLPWALQHPGHEGLQVLRPAAGSRDYTTISRFRDEASRRAFTGSDAYAAWLARLGRLTEGDPRIQELSGLEGFVSWPGGELRRPPTWKLAVATFLGVLPTASALAVLLGPRLEGLPFLAGQALFAAAMVGLLSWLVMPLVTRALHRWLFAGGAQR